VATLVRPLVIKTPTDDTRYGPRNRPYPWVAAVAQAVEHEDAKKNSQDEQRRIVTPDGADSVLIPSIATVLIKKYATAVHTFEGASTLASGGELYELTHGSIKEEVMWMCKRKCQVFSFCVGRLLFHLFRVARGELKAPGFNPRTFMFQNSLQNLLLKCNLNRYAAEASASRAVS
jgi:hypothetical protein